MGWKSIKEHYKIGHIVQVTSKGICIGSGYIHDIIVIDKDTGAVIKPYLKDGWSSNDDLLRYQSEMDGDPEKLKELVFQEDTFEKNIPVFTFDGAEIIQEFCEELGWPNLTHGGNIMYENTYSQDVEQVIKWAKKEAEAIIKNSQCRIQEIKNDLSRHQERLSTAERNLTSLNRM